MSSIFGITGEKPDFRHAAVFAVIASAAPLSTVHTQAEGGEFINQHSVQNICTSGICVYRDTPRTRSLAPSNRNEPSFSSSRKPHRGPSRLPAPCGPRSRSLLRCLMRQSVSQDNHASDCGSCLIGPAICSHSSHSIVSIILIIAFISI